ncbi:MAG: MFS transporter [Caldilineales bacterium]|nr:MFS transporter [Caldilineales bacterium]MDW8317022.1 MFS transporter [Anaerolineae bacterium]
MALPRRGETSFGPVLQNRAFRSLWLAQVLAQTAQNANNFMLIVLIERLTAATIHQGLMIMAFTLPGVLFAPISGVVIDRLPKKWVLVGSNLLRALSALSYALLIWMAPGHSAWWLLMMVYGVAFLTATVGQFFNPAEAATIPLLVARPYLIAANSLFTLTLAMAQVVGLIIIGPVAVKLIGLRSAFVLMSAMYLLAALSVRRIPRDQPSCRSQQARSAWHQAWVDFREGWQFVVQRPPIAIAMSHLTLIASLVMMMAMLAPGIASRVLHLAPEDAIVVFAPAGLGMLLTAFALGRWGNRLPKERLARLGLVGIATGFVSLGWIAWRFQITNTTLALDLATVTKPSAGAGLILATVGLSLFLGLTMSGVNIVSQTILHERTTDAVRGRVFAVQFMLNNLVGIPPMLATGGIADLIGIPPVLVGIGVAVAAVLGATVAAERRYRRRLVSATPAAPGVSASTGEREVAPEPGASADQSAARRVVSPSSEKERRSATQRAGTLP